MFDFNHPKICPICQNAKNFLLVKDFARENTKYYLYECPKCKVQFWLPRVVVTKEWYEKEGNPYHIRDLAKLKISRGYHKFFLEKYKNLPQGTRVLDLGCGTGEFLAELSKKGCDVFGLDFDRDAVKIAGQRFGLKNVYAMSFEEFFKKQDLPKFDMITFFEVIEHLPDPLTFISEVKKLLKPSGKVVLSTPCRERMLANLNSWDFPPHHLTRWNKEAILKVFSISGLRVSDVLYVEELKILSESAAARFKTGLVGKSLQGKSGQKKSLVIPKIIYFMGRAKHMVLGKFPALFLWAFSKMIGRNNGIMYIEAKLI